MRILLVYPGFPETFWSFKHSLKFISKKALLPPLGLLTIASILPEKFEKKLIDMNVSKLKDKNIQWADYVFISAMISQKESVKEIIARCKACGAKVVAGGPLFSSLYEEYPEVDHFILDEGEITLPLFLEDLKNGNPQRVYTSEIKPDIKLSPVPQWNLINLKHYMKMPVQYSRGCPFDCEFCDIVKLNGKIPRTKKPIQVIKELNALIRLGWKNPIFIVDDNFIGNKALTKSLLKALIRWRKWTGQKLRFMTEVSLNLADDKELMELMRDAGFDSVFVGLETPSVESLKECGKFQNSNRDLVSSVNKIQHYGIEVSGGFIVGFDSDDTTIFARQIEFIQKTGVVVAMVGLLQALPGTRLYERLKNENRLISDSSGNNTDFSINFLPKIDVDTLIKGYESIIASVYSPQKYYERVQTFLSNYKAYNKERITFNHILALLKSMCVLGVIQKHRKYYWKLFFISLFKYPGAFSKAITMTVYYAHFSKIFPQLELTESLIEPDTEQTAG
jgi:radical SAM superfamily enzyme YgiQ (UPF0313 family)